MSDVKCPYCGAEQEINHDDGYGYEEGEAHEQECGRCEREFEFSTSISFSYSVYCVDGDHDEVVTIQDGYSHTSCARCDLRECNKL